MVIPISGNSEVVPLYSDESVVLNQVDCVITKNTGDNNTH